MLTKNGDTATYMQYAYARVSGIFRKGEVDREQLRSQSGGIRLTHPKERALAVKLNQFAEVLGSAAVDCKPSYLTDYLFTTANTFSSFYDDDDCSVLKAATPELRISRLQLADLTARVLGRGLELLGIETIEQM